jgi:predicted Zn-dependent protease
LLVVGLGIAGAGFWHVARKPLSARYHAMRAESFEEKARAALAADRLDDAQLYVKEANRHQTTPARLQLWGDVLRKQGNSMYLGVFDRALSQDSNNVVLARSFVAGAATLGARDFASQRVVELVTRFPDDPELLLAAGKFYIVSREPTPAVNLLRRAESLDRNNPTIAFALASACSMSLEPAVKQEGRKRLEALRQLPAFWEATTLALARFRSQDEPNAARLLWAELLARKPDVWSYQLGQLDNLHEIKDPAWRARLKELGKAANSRERRFDVARRIGLWDGTAAFDAWLKEMPSDEVKSEVVTALRLDVLAAAGDHSGVAALAAAETRRAGVPPAHAARCWVAAARAQRALGDAEVARMNARNAASVAENNPQLAYMVGQVMEELGLNAEALRLYEASAVSTGSVRMKSLEALNRRAMADGESDRLTSVLERVASGENPDVLALNNLACLLVQDPNTAARGLDLAERARAARPGDPLVTDTYAWALLQNGRTAEALALYEALPGPTFQNPEVTLHFAETLNRSGQRARARELVKDLSDDKLLPRDREVLQALRAP